MGTQDERITTRSHMVINMVTSTDTLATNSMIVNTRIMVTSMNIMHMVIALKKAG